MSKRFVFEFAPGRRVALCAISLVAGVVLVLPPLDAASASVSSPRTPTPAFTPPR